MDSGKHTRGSSSYLVRKIPAALAILLTFGSLAVAMLSYIRQIRLGGEIWLARDWLIDYSGGFVRRGLIGHLIGFLPHDLTWQIAAVVAIQFGLAVAFCTYLFLYTRSAQYSWSSLALACSPMVAAFAGWFPGAAFSKELLPLVSLVLLALSWRWSSYSKERGLGRVVWTLAIGIVLFTVSLFSWEPSIVILPLVVWLTYTNRSLSRWWRISLVGLEVTLALAALAGSVLWHGDAAVADAMCDSFKSRLAGLSDICGPPITFMRMSSTEALSWVWSAGWNRALYLPVIALASIPLLGTKWLTSHWRISTLVIILSLPLFALGTDWFRWIHYVASALTVAVVAQGKEAKSSISWRPIWTTAYLLLWGPITLDAGWKWGGGLYWVGRAIGG